MSEIDQEKGSHLISDQERDLALNASTEFKKKNYSACFQIINKLETSRPNDFKVVHNKAVVEYFKSDLYKTEQFQKNLTNVCQQFKIKVDKLEEIDYCIAQFNQAIILYHQRQYTAAQRIMDRVYKFIEPMEENLAKQVSLLAIELQLCLKQPEKALTFISYLENNLMYGASIPLKGLDRNGRDKKFPLPTPKPISEDFQKKLLKYKIRCYLLKHSLTIASKGLKTLLKDKNNVDALFMASNLKYLKGNLDESLKILSTIPEDCLNYNDCGESSRIMLNNNLGVIHHALGKPNLACHYFQKALKEDINLNQNTQKKDDRHLYCMGSSKYHELMYNLGVSLLYAGRAAQAFDCLIICVRRYHRNSRLWLRIAECCMVVHKQSNEIDFDLKTKQKELIVEVIGSKRQQMVILTDKLSKDKKYSVESQSYAVPVPSLEFASLCLRNAKLLLPADAAELPAVPLFLVPGVPVPPPSPSLAPSSPSCASEIQILKNTILVASSYVALCLGDYIMALKHAQELLSQERASSVHRLLAHMYAAECLILLDRIPEALEHLSLENIKDLEFNLPNGACVSADDQIKTNPPPKWVPSNLESVHAVLQYNIAVAKTIRGQLDQASAILKQIWQKRTPTCRVPAHIIMLVIYIELQLGHADVARNLLRQYSIQHRITG
ncbi:CCR4-NOT transcription complex subunit 10 isoform X1 [Rhynchophorus ferrugineus]|uniref:CCR4-NOT transcription complex subunit 10 isoform X1 n=1 Tax=Rhynchophorus ferrugineus TaxID=354439 RepID=UPI003FCE6B2C